MSLGTIAGFFGGIGLFVVSVFMSTDAPGAFINVPSFVMVVGGTFAAAFISFETKIVLTSFKRSGTIFSAHKEATVSMKEEVGRMVRWGYVVQKNGLQGLESDAAEAIGNDKFLQYGVDLVVTGYTGAEIRAILEDMVASTVTRSKRETDVLVKMAGDSPAFGMIGTLIGLIIMLGNMGGDPSAIGPGMAVALITTLYGVFAARLFFMPFGAKLVARDSIKEFRELLVTEGLVLLAERKSPRYIQDKMNSFVDLTEQFNIDTDMDEK